MDKNINQQINKYNDMEMAAEMFAEILIKQIENEKLETTNIKKYETERKPKDNS